MNWSLLRNYVSGKCNEDELRQLSLWIKESSANEDFFISFIENWDSEANENFEEDLQQEWLKFKTQVLDIPPSYALQDGLRFINPSKIAETSNTLRLRRKKRQYLSNVLSLICMVMLAVVTLLISDSQSLLEQTEQSEVITYKDIITSRGQRSKIQLTDGTKIVLNSSSELKIPDNFGPENRQVYLKGEAFFEVTHSEENPFTVLSDNAFAKDLGTKFNVKTLDDALEVAVQEGIVSLGRVELGIAQEDLAELTENKLGTIGSEGEPVVSEIPNIDLFTGWAEEKLVFRQTPLPEVISRLEEWFDIECNIQGIPNPADQTLTATYDGVSLNEVLKVLAVSMNVSYTKDGKTITFNEIDK